MSGMWAAMIVMLLASEAFATPPSLTVKREHKDGSVVTEYSRNGQVVAKATRFANGMIEVKGDTVFALPGTRSAYRVINVVGVAKRSAGMGGLVRQLEWHVGGPRGDYGTVWQFRDGTTSSTHRVTPVGRFDRKGSNGWWTR